MLRETALGLLVVATAGCKGADGSPSTDASAGAPASGSASSIAPPASAKPATIDVTVAIASCKNGEQTACSTACDGADLPSCVALGELALKGSDSNARRACAAPLKKACDGSVGKACSTLASRCLVLDGTKEEKAALNERACTLNDGTGCLNAAINYEQGYGVAPDAAKAKELAARALGLLPKECDGGDPKSCSTIASLYDPDTKSKRVPKDKTRAATLYRKACDGGEQNACDAAKRLGGRTTATAGSTGGTTSVAKRTCIPCPDGYSATSNAALTYCSCMNGSGDDKTVQPPRAGCIPAGPCGIGCAFTCP